jgi:hypothetical protein|tara:strand:- start:105 stop:494 length:390 start_codon:yes stop_codon:yes gene_type:complete
MSELILNNPSHWLLEQLYNAKKTDIETYRVFKTYERYFNDKRDFIGVAEQVTSSTLRYKPLTDLADDCLFSVTFFRGVIKSRQRRRGAPGVRYYANAGKQAFKMTGYPTICMNWEFWVNYVNNTVSLNK